MVKLSEVGVYWRDHYAILDQWNKYPSPLMPRAVGFELIKCLELRKPKVIVEDGCGLSTILLAGYAVNSGAKVVSLEYNQHYFRETKALIQKMGLDRFIDLRLVEPHPVHWYQTELPDQIEFALVNGPSPTGQQVSFPALYDKLNPEMWQVWLNGSRSHHRLLEEWHQQYQVDYRLYPLPGELAILRNRNLPIESVDGSDVAITIHAKWDLEHLTKTFDSLNSWAPGLLQSAHVTVMYTDYRSTHLDQFREYGSYLNVLDVNNNPDLVPGDIYSRLFTQIPINMKYHLHLEPGWTVGTLGLKWLNVAKTILELDEEVGQVRLQHRSVPSRRYNLTDGAEVQWEKENDWLVGNAEYAIAPSLMRPSDVLKLWPARSDLVAASRFHKDVAQLNPGVFHRPTDDFFPIREPQRILEDPQ